MTAPRAPYRRKTTGHRRLYTESEAAFQDKIIALARFCGWKAMHMRDSRGQDAEGFPDIVLAHPNGWLVIAELKSAKGVVSEKQRDWLDALAQCDFGDRAVIGALWRPDAWDEIEALLTGAREVA